MSSALPVKISSTNRDGEQKFQATVSIPGVKPTKLVRKSDDSTLFGTRSAAVTSARSLAKRLGFDGVEATGAETTRKAAKKSVASTTTD